MSRTASRLTSPRVTASLVTFWQYQAITPTTRWFSPNVIPIHDGQYEVECRPLWNGDERVIDRMTFSRGDWFHMDGERSECGGPSSGLRWRGLTAPA